MTTDEAISPWGATRRKRSGKYPAKKEAVLVAAAALMHRNGYEGTSLSDLADLLHITKPTLYYYVGSKEELLSVIVTRVQLEMIEVITATSEKSATGLEKLREIMIRYSHTMMSDFGACLLLRWPESVEAGLRLEYNSRNRAANELIVRIILEGQRDGTIRASDPMIVLNALFGSLNWLPRWYKSNGRLSPQKLAETHVDLLLSGMAPQAGEPASARPQSRRTPRKTSD